MATRVWFALATFSCSALIFWVEPLTGKQLLPLVGGAPAVWNVCLLFFQLALLLGYAFAHGLTRIPAARAQAGVYLLVVVAGALLLPARFTAVPADPSQPAVWLLLQLAQELLLPFVALAAAAPLLQHWYSRTTSASAHDPYFLYASSNAGSLLALLAFPVLLEPSFSIGAQSRAWTALFVAVMLLSAATSLRARTAIAPAAATPSSRPHVRELLPWMLLAAVPSSLLMGVTTYVTADIAPVPLLWVVPLAIYLATFIFAFARRRPLPQWFGGVVAKVAVAWCAVYRLQGTDPFLLLVGVHLLAFAVLAVGVHVKLAERRPDASHLTLYYLAISAGGALGGMFNALAAPAVFDSFAEYPIAVLAAVWLNLRSEGERPTLRVDVLPVLVVALVSVLALTLVDMPSGAPRSLVVVGVPVALAYVLSRRALRYTAALAIVLAGARFDPALVSNVLHAERNFYGLLRVSTAENGRFVELRHGSTLHGAIDVTTAGGSEPLSYYWTGSPIADVLRDAQRTRDSMDVAVVGLGVGALAWYARPDERWTFYEINPAVVRLARDTTLFHFLARSRAGELRIDAGDARLRLQHAPDSSYDVIVLDAFTSDAVPLHLLTREAVALYARKLAPDGIVVFHISNRYLALPDPLAAVARANGFRAYLREQHLDDEARRARRESSEWLVLARDFDAFPPGRSTEWLGVLPRSERPWTDDYSNLWSAFMR